MQNGFTYIYTFLPGQTDSTQHVPLTPAPRLTTEIKIKLTDRYHSILRGTYIEFGQHKYWAQNNIYSAVYTELTSQAYTLYNAGIGTNFINPTTGSVLCSFYVNVTTLTNIAYVDHLSRNAYFRAYNAEPVIVTKLNQGIYNMGRNIGLKAIFPIGSHKVSDTELHGLEY